MFSGWTLVVAMAFLSVLIAVLLFSAFVTLGAKADIRAAVAMHVAVLVDVAEHVVVGPPGAPVPHVLTCCLNQNSGR